MAKKQSTINGIDVDTLRETVSQIEGDPELGRCVFRATNRWIAGAQNRTNVTDFYAAKQELRHARPFELQADEPPMLAGRDEAANPVEHLLHALASCLTTSLVAHAAVNGIALESVESRVEGDIDLNGFLGLSQDVPRGYRTIRVAFKVKTDQANREKLETLARHSPVFNTITDGARVELRIDPA